ncbi:MAG: hypothetical protein EOP45_06745 [Sphingobacteriaceae bacterium]|nr:MAG: hypothetical protein EOP45_06745 [Sphingobacteriaceae bacterium]
MKIVVNAVNEDCGDSLVSRLKYRGRQYMNKNLGDFRPTFYHKAMTFLNPSMKRLTQLSLVERMNFQVEVEDYIKTTFPNETSEREPFGCEPIHGQDNLLDSFVCFDDQEIYPESEVGRYMLHPIKQVVDVKKWWLDNG